MDRPLLRKVDAVTFRVPDLDAGLAFYRDVVADPFDNVLVLVDLSKGTYDTDEQGGVTSVT